MIIHYKLENNALDQLATPKNIKKGKYQSAENVMYILMMSQLAQHFLIIHNAIEKLNLQAEWKIFSWESYTDLFVNSFQKCTDFRHTE